MQVWLFFIAGTGGDGFANLLERSANVTPIDGNKDWWRIHRIVNNSTKFYAPSIDQNGCFRISCPFESTTNRLLDQYVNLVDNNINTIVTSHDITLRDLNASDSLDVLTKNQVKILIDINNYSRAFYNNSLKNLMPILTDAPVHNINHSNFDFVLDIDRIQSDWAYVDNFCRQLNLQLDITDYYTYQEISKGNTAYMTNNYNIDRFQAVVCNNLVSYQKLDVWQRLET